MLVAVLGGHTDGCREGQVVLGYAARQQGCRERCWDSDVPLQMRGGRRQQAGIREQLCHHAQMQNDVTEDTRTRPFSFRVCFGATQIKQYVTMR